MASPCEWGQHAKFLQLPWDPDLDRKSWQDGKESKIHTAGIQAAVRKESQRTIHLFSWTSTAKSNGVVFPRLLTFYGPDFQALIFSTLSNTWVLWSDPSVCSWWTLLRLVLCVFLKLPNWKRTSVLLVWGGLFLQHLEGISFWFYHGRLFPASSPLENQPSLVLWDVPVENRRGPP